MQEEQLQAYWALALLAELDWFDAVEAEPGLLHSHFAQFVHPPHCQQVRGRSFARKYNRTAMQLKPWIKRKGFA